MATGIFLPVIYVRGTFYQVGYDVVRNEQNEFNLNIEFTEMDNDEDVDRPLLATIDNNCISDM